MSHMIVELILWMLLAFFIGCILGYLARRIFASEPAAVAREPAAQASPSPAPLPATPAIVPPEPEKVTLEPVSVIVAAPVGAPAPVLRPAVPQEAMLAAATTKSERPKGIAKARTGKADNLQRISGIGPKYERTLHNLGFYHFDQIAVWSAEHIDWVDDHLKFNGRIQREEWVAQARLLADGKEDEFVAKYGTGGLRNKAGESKSGSRTRRR